MKEGSLEKECRGLTASWQKIGPKTQGVGLTEAWVSAELHSLETWSHAPLTCRLGVQLVTILSWLRSRHQQEESRGWWEGRF